MTTVTSKHRLYAARILTNLAATTAGSSSKEEKQADPDDEASYYGRPPTTWPTLLLRNPAVLQGLHKVLQEQSDVLLLQQCCWAIGNLASEQMSSSLLVYCDGLLAVLHKAFYHTGVEHDRIQLCRNVMWALSNLVRGGTTSSRPFVASKVLSPQLIAHLLLSPEQQPQQQPQQQGTTWNDVAYETAWLVAYLTAKEEETVGYLLEPLSTNAVTFSSQTPSLICEGLACRLDQAVRRVRQTPSLQDQQTMNALKMTLPLIRAIGNIASTVMGRHITSLLEAHHQSVVMSLASLIEIGTFPASKTHSDLSTVATEATWAAGTLLCDAGVHEHVSTVLAVPRLLPQLVNCIVSEQTVPSLKREALQALWNMLAAPPSDETDMGKVWSTRATRDEFLDDMVKARPGFLVSLVDLLDSYDQEIVIDAVQLVNAFLRRRADAYKIPLEEAGVMESLERICDRASMQHMGNYEMNGSPEAANVAADLLDDVFEEQLMDKDDGDNENNNNNNNDFMSMAPAIEGDTFAFGVPAAVQDPGPSAVSMGRGRGKQMPAWMTQQRQAQHQTHTM